MIIDIDIKIADSDGKLIQRFEKTFNNVDATGDKLNFNLDLGKTFENFLSEYMSYSGRIVRDKLMPYYSAPIPYQTIHNYFEEETMHLDSNINKELKDREIEYSISIGNGNVFSGKFPVKKLIQFSDSIDIKPENNQLDNAVDDIELSHQMTKAIEKYEANFFQIYQDDNEWDDKEMEMLLTTPHTPSAGSDTPKTPPV